MKRDLVFVVVITQVGTQANETGQVPVPQVRIDGTQLLGVYEHLQVLVLAHVVTGVLVHRACVMRAEVHYTNDHGLLVLRNELGLTRIGLTAYSRRQHIVNRCAGTILLDVNSLHVNGCGRVDRCADRSQVAGVLSPITAYEVQCGKTQVCLVLTACEVHTHETNRFPVADRAYLLHAGAVTAERYLELIPGHILCRTVTERHTAHFLLGDMLTTDLHHVGAENNFVLIVFLVLVECVIEVDILHIRREGRGSTVTLGLLLGSRRVTFGTVVVLVAVEDRHLLLVEVCAAVVMEIITGRVSTGREVIVVPCIPHIRRNAALQFGQVLLISGPIQLLLRAQTVEPDILHSACSGLVAERYHGAGSTRDVAPHGRINTTGVCCGDRQTVLKRFLTVS